MNKKKKITEPKLKGRVVTLIVTLAVNFLVAKEKWELSWVIYRSLMNENL